MPPVESATEHAHGWDDDQESRKPPQRARLDVQRTLLQWLHARCSEEPFRSLYEQAVRRFLSSQSKELLIVGVLIRDTPPNEADLQSRGKALAKKLPSPTRVELFAWYLPVPISEWPRLLQEKAL